MSGRPRRASSRRSNGGLGGRRGLVTSFAEQCLCLHRAAAQFATRLYLRGGLCATLRLRCRWIRPDCSISYWWCSSRFRLSDRYLLLLLRSLLNRCLLGSSRSLLSGGLCLLYDRFGWIAL
jgi:hypothetical protein